MTPLYVQNAEPGEEVCDFCDSTDVQWVFPCRDHQAPEEHVEALVLQRNSDASVTGADITAISAGDWAACSACHALIVRGDRERLARRSAKRVQRKYAKRNVLMGLKDLTAHVRRRQDAFWTNREGPPFPVSDSSRIRRGQTP
jgi:ferredoxin